MCATTAAASEPASISPFVPMPMRSGLPKRATTIFSGSRLDTTATPYVPSTFASASATASSNAIPSFHRKSIRWTIVSVSVSDEKQ